MEFWSGHLRGSPSSCAGRHGKRFYGRVSGLPTALVTSPRLPRLLFRRTLPATGGPMAQVFLSYDREDAPRARVIAQRAGTRRPLRLVGPAYQGRRRVWPRDRAGACAVGCGGRAVVKPFDQFRLGARRGGGGTRQWAAGSDPDRDGQPADGVPPVPEPRFQRLEGPRQAATYGRAAGFDCGPWRDRNFSRTSRDDEAPGNFLVKPGHPESQMVVDRRRARPAPRPADRAPVGGQVVGACRRGSYCRFRCQFSGHGARLVRAAGPGAIGTDPVRSARR